MAEAYCGSLRRVQRTGRQRRGWIERVLATQDLLDLTVGGDDKRNSLRVAVRPDAVGFADAAVVVGEQREWQLQALGKLLLCLDVVGGDTQDLGIGVGELRGEVAKSRQLAGSTAGESLREEGQHHRAPLELLERDRLAVRRRAREVRRGLADGQSGRYREQRGSDENRTRVHATKVHRTFPRTQPSLRGRDAEPRARRRGEHRLPVI
jgi:hypothetical protein